METKAQYGIIGLFTLLVAGLAFFMIYWVGRLDESGNAVPVEIAFPGSVSGLIPGSSVLFNGIRVGTVRGLSLDPDNPQIVVVNADVDAATPLKTDTRISLGAVGLTGASYVEFNGGSVEAATILDDPARGRLQADSSSVDDLLQTAEIVLGRVDQISREMTDLVSRNTGEIDRIIGNAADFSQALAANSDGIERFLATTSKSAEQIGTLAVQLETLTDKADRLVSAIAPEQVAQTVDNLESFTGSISDTAGNLDALLAEAQSVLQNFNEFSGALTGTLADLNGLFADVSGTEISNIVSNIDAITSALEERTDTIDRLFANVEAGSDSFRSFGEKINAQANSFDDITRNVSELTAKLNSSADRLDGILGGADSLLASDNTQGVMADLQLTLQSVRRAASTFEVQLAEISTGVNRFSGSGLRNLDGLISDSRAAVNRLNSVLQSLEASPRRFISGGGGVPEYNGRQRR